MHIIAAAFLFAAVTGSRDAQLLAEIDRLDAVLKKHEATATGNLAELPKLYRAALDRARQARTPETRLYRMRGAYSGIEGLAYMSEHADAGKDFAVLSALWKKEQPRFAKKVAPRGTFLERAVEEAAINRAEKMNAASIAYGKVDSPSSGLYYIAEAVGNLKYRDYVLSMASAPDATRVPTEANLRNAFNELQAEAIRMFEKEPTAGTMLNANAKLKETRELLDAKKLEAATLVLLESRYELSKHGLRNASAPELAPNKDGITALFSEVAGLEAPENSRAIRNDVLPLYASLPSRVAVVSRSVKPVTVTLIRWPYT